MTLRKNVALVIVNGAGQVLIGERTDIASAWQLPQGGVDPGETIEAAGWRELAEETGLGPETVVLAGSAGPFVYHLPEGVVSERGFNGQEQTYLLFRLTDATVNPQPNEEFRLFRWVSPREAIDLVVSFKRPCYEAAFRTFFGENP